MKNSIIITIALLGLTTPVWAQNINWQAFQPEQKQFVQIQTGWDYGMTFGLGYGRKFNTKMPVLVNIGYSFPAGERLFDDFKVRLGGQVEVIRRGGFSATVKVYSPFRRFENSLVRLINFGGEFSGVAGFYRKHWYVAGEFGFDKAIATHVRHTDLERETYPDARDGWYVPTGGNYFYGLQAGVSFGKSDVSLKAGNLATQGWKTKPYVPKYAVLEYNYRF